MKRLVLTTLVLTSTSLWSQVNGKIANIVTQDECSDVDIREIKPQLKSILSAPRDQGKIGWCFGFAAADLISAEKGQLISSAHVSAIYNKRVASNFFWRIGYSVGNVFTGDGIGDVYEGGWMGKAIKSVRKMETVCLEKDMAYDKNYRGEFKNMILRLGSLQYHLKKRLIEDDKAQLIIKDILPSNIFSNLDYVQVLEELKQRNLNKVLEAAMRQSCGDKAVAIDDYDIEKSGNHGVDYKNEESFAKSRRKALGFFENLNTALESGKPVGLSYNVTPVMDIDRINADIAKDRKILADKFALKGKSYEQGCGEDLENLKDYFVKEFSIDLEASCLALKKFADNDPGKHASVLVARRWSKASNRCEYKIRNSWGQTCYPYNTSLVECIQEEGSFWVTDTMLNKIADDITFIRN